MVVSYKVISQNELLADYDVYIITGDLLVIVYTYIASIEPVPSFSVILKSDKITTEIKHTTLIWQQWILRLYEKVKKLIENLYYYEL